MGDINTNIRIDELETVVDKIAEKLPVVVSFEVDLTVGSGDCPEGTFDTLQRAIYDGKAVILYTYSPLVGNQPPKDREILTFTSFVMNASQITAQSGELEKTILINSSNEYEIT